MKIRFLATALAMGSSGCIFSAQAATYVVTSKSQSFDTQLARKVEAAGGTIAARLAQIGVAIVESRDSTFAARAEKVPGIRSAVPDYVMQFAMPEGLGGVEETFRNAPASDDDHRFN